MVVFLETQRLPSRGGRWVASDHQGQHRAGNRICLWKFFPQHSAPREKTAAREQKG